MLLHVGYTDAVLKRCLPVLEEWAVGGGWVDTSPVDEFRRQLSRGNRTAAHRARRDPKQNIRPLTAAELGVFLAESERLGGGGRVVSLLLADAGLRLGEALALDWSDVHFG